MAANQVKLTSGLQTPKRREPCTMATQELLLRNNRKNIGKGLIDLTKTICLWRVKRKLFIPLKRKKYKKEQDEAFFSLSPQFLSLENEKKGARLKEGKREEGKKNLLKPTFFQRWFLPLVGCSTMVLLKWLGELLIKLEMRFQLPQDFCWLCKNFFSDFFFFAKLSFLA